MKKILIIDNNIDPDEIGKPSLGAPFRRYLSEGEIHVRRGPQSDLPLDVNEFSHIIISGSKTSCLSQDEWVKEQMEFLKKAIAAQKKVLGICFGHQIIARAFGGMKMVRKAAHPEFGWVQIEQAKAHPLLKDLPASFHSFQSHFEEVAELPPEFEATSLSRHCGIQSFKHRNLPVFGLQFHPERNDAEGECSLEVKKKDKSLSKDCIFNPGRAKSLYSEKVALAIFKNFTALD